MRAEGAGNATTDPCHRRCLASGDDCPGEANYRAAIDCDKRARGGRSKASTSNDGQACCAGITGEARYAFDASEAIRVDSARRTRFSDARETCAVNGYGEARADETRDAGADDEASDTAGSNSSKANGSGAARDVTEPDAGSHGAEGAAQVDEGHRPHDEADAEESGGRSAGRIP